LLSNKEYLYKFKQIINEANWTFASTMPHNPHWYVVRGKTMSEENYSFLFEFIKKCAIKQEFEGKWYDCVEYNNYIYWIMSRTLDDKLGHPRSKIINRRKKTDED